MPPCPVRELGCSCRERSCSDLTKSRWCSRLCQLSRSGASLLLEGRGGYSKCSSNICARTGENPSPSCTWPPSEVRLPDQSVVFRETEPAGSACVRVCACIYGEQELKELAQLGPPRVQTPTEVRRQAGDGHESCCARPEAGWLLGQVLLLSRGGGGCQCELGRPSTDWARPTHILEAHRYPQGPRIPMLGCMHVICCLLCFDAF